MFTDDNTHHIAVCYPEFLLASRGDEADASFGLLHVPVKQSPAIRIDMDMVFLSNRGTSDQIGIVLGVGAEHIFIAVAE
ncbi:hypothetical protein K440107A6_38860 [Lawsonibacter asaccharolyticus]